MFGLPLSTTLLVVGFPVFWIVYTLCFLTMTRDWSDDETADDGSS